MTENKESKEDTINKLTSFSWQRKLNERNSFPKCVNSESDQLWKAVAKPNSELRFNDEIVKQARQNQTHAFKTKNELMLATSKQSRDDNHFVKLEGNENDNENTLVAVKEFSSDKKRERQLKNRNSYDEQNYRKDEKENVNHHKNIHRANPSNQTNTQNQKYFKRGGKNLNSRTIKNESLAPVSNGNENFVKKDQRNSIFQSSWNNSQSNRTYHRNQEKSTNQNNYKPNETKIRSSHQNVSRNQNFQQNDFNAEKSQLTGDPSNRSISTGENSFSCVPSNYSKSGTGIAQENPSSAIHYQRTFTPKIRNNGTCNQATKTGFDGKYIPQTEFAQLDSSFGNATSNVNNIYSRENNDFVDGQFTNFSNADNFSNDLLSHHFTAGISEPIPTDDYQNDKSQTNIQTSQSPNIPMVTVTHVNSYIPSSQPLMSNNFNKPSSYSNQMLANNSQHQFVNKSGLSDNIPATFSSLSPEVEDFIPRKHRIQDANRVAYSNSVENLQQEIELKTRNAFSFSTSNNNQSQSTGWLSQNNSFISDCNESMISENGGFQSCVDVLTTFNQNNSGGGLNDVSNPQPTAVRSVLNNANNEQTFNFNGRKINLSNKNSLSSGQKFNLNRRIVSLSGETMQSNMNERPSTNDFVQNFYLCEDDSIGNNFNCGLKNYPYISQYGGGNLGFNTQQISNILQIANLHLNQEASSVSTPCNQVINDLLQMSNSNVSENILKQTTVSSLPQTVVNNSSHPSICGVMQNSRVNTMRDYYRKPTADVANHLKCAESEEMNSKLEMVAQQLFNVNKYVTGAEMSGGTMTFKDSVRHSNSGRFNMATFNRYKNELEKYHNSRNFSNDDECGLLSLSGNSENRYENLYTPTSIATLKSCDSFSSQTSSNSNFIRNPEPQFGIGSNGNPNNSNNSVSSNQFIASMMTFDKNVTNNFQNNYGRSNVQRSSTDRYRQANSASESNTLSQNRQNSFKREFLPNHDRKMFNNQVRMTNNTPENYRCATVRDDSFINFTRKNRSADSNYPKFNVTVGKPPSMGILKKALKPILDTTIQFQKSPMDQNTDDLFSSSKETFPLNKRVSFLLENDYTK